MSATSQFCELCMGSTYQPSAWGSDLISQSNPHCASELRQECISVRWIHKIEVLWVCRDGFIHGVVIPDTVAGANAPEFVCMLVDSMREVDRPQSAASDLEDDIYPCAVLRPDDEILIMSLGRFQIVQQWFVRGPVRWILFLAAECELPCGVCFAQL